LVGWTTKQRKKTEQPNCALHRHVQPLISTSGVAACVYTTSYTAIATTYVGIRYCLRRCVKESLCFVLLAQHSPGFPNKTLALDIESRRVSRRFNAMLQTSVKCALLLFLIHTHTRMAAHVRAHIRADARPPDTGWLVVAGVLRSYR